MLVRLVSNSLPQVIHPPWPPKVQSAGITGVSHHAQHSVSTLLSTVLMSVSLLEIIALILKLDFTLCLLSGLEDLSRVYVLPLKNLATIAQEECTNSFPQHESHKNCEKVFPKISVRRSC